MQDVVARGWECRTLVGQHFGPGLDAGPIGIGQLSATAAPTPN